MAARNLAIDIRDPRIPGGRLAISSGTTDPDTRDAYRAAIVAVLDTEHGAEIVRRLKLTRRMPGVLWPKDVFEAVRAFNVAALVADGAGGAPEAVRPAMLGEMCDRFLQHIRSDASEGTAESYGIVVRQMQAEFGVERDRRGRITRDIPVQSVTRDQAMRFLKRPRKTAGNRPWSPQRQAVAHTVGQQIWAMALVYEEDQAERLGIDWKPWRNFWAADRQRPKGTVRPAKKQRTRHNFPHRDQAARLLRATKGTRLAAWVAVGLYGGLRMGEAIHLRTVQDVDLERGELRIQSRKGDHPWRPKSGRPREVPMSRALERWIKRHIRDGFAGERYMFRPAGADQPISRDTGRRWTKEAFEAAMIKYGGRTGDAMSHHSLRHGFGSWLAMQGVSPAAIADLMGNTMQVVLDTYIHLYPGERRRSVERMRRKPI